MAQTYDGGYPNGGHEEKYVRDGGGRFGEEARRSAQAEAGSSVFVTNLQWWTSDVHLERLCSEYGQVLGIRFIEDRACGKSRGMAVVDFVEPAAAGKCISGLNGRDINGRACRVNYQAGSAPRGAPPASTSSQGGSGGMAAEMAAGMPVPPPPGRGPMGGQPGRGGGGGGHGPMGGGGHGGRGPMGMDMGGGMMGMQGMPIGMHGMMGMGGPMGMDPMMNPMMGGLLHPGMMGGMMHPGMMGGMGGMPVPVGGMPFRPPPPPGPPPPGPPKREAN